ncbi:MAG: 5-formyltetrahydrofolate cyclo-ligase [Chloroflexota bacterium]
MKNKKLKWAGRNSAKDRLRVSIWTALQDSGAGIGKIWDSIPNFVDAEAAAERLSQLPIWKEAKVIKSNPDTPQIPVRYRALRDGKLLYMPVPQLAQEFPFLLLDPAKLTEEEISFAEAARKEGALKHGQRVQFSEMLPMDLLVVGCVAAGRDGGRTGKGGGFADLELGIFREMGLIPNHAKLVTTVHDLQIVDDERLTLQTHDSPLDWIVTPNEVIETSTSYPRPKGVYWDDILSEQYEAIPFLKTLRERLEGK